MKQDITENVPDVIDHRGQGEKENTAIPEQRIVFNDEVGQLLTRTKKEQKKSNNDKAKSGQVQKPNTDEITKKIMGHSHKDSYDEERQGRRRLLLNIAT